MVKILSREELEKLTTKRLLAYKNKLMKVCEGPDWDEEGTIGGIIRLFRLNKSSPIWQETYKNVKEILATREHIEK